MILISKVRGDDSARAVAQDYVNRFPAGTYAARARVLAGP
jgi:TolA-binding protein